MMREPGPAGGPAPLAVRGMTVMYDGRPAVEQASLTVAPGRLVAVVGPNGAGKSTLIKGMLGLVPVAAGSVEMFGREIDQVRARVAYVPQRAAVDWDFPASALDVVTMGLYGRIGWLRPIRRRHKEAAQAALGQVGLSDYAARPIGALSGGQQQRVFFARALVQNADLMFLDEPFAGVDATTESIIFEHLKALRDSGRSVVVVHHDLDSVAEHFDDAIVINRRVVASGPVDDVFTPHNLAQAYGARLTSALTGLTLG
jgi:manganese/zinc/iron transport system ATP- binding protein